MRKALLFFSACCTIVLISWQIKPVRWHWQPPIGFQFPDEFAGNLKKPRPIYRFSVIPGGAYSSDELASARRTDAVVQAHYADFRTERATLARLPSQTYMYVSYRKADRVYWSVKKHRIPKGEPVLTDGSHLARARCGNRLSLLPMFPTLPGPQLPEETFNAPEPPQNLQLPPAPLLSASYDVPDLPFAVSVPKTQAFPSTTGAAAPISGGPFATPFTGLLGPVFGPAGIVGTTRPGGSTGGNTGGGSTGTSGGGGGGVTLGSVPEPATGLLLGFVGISALLLRKIHSRRLPRDL